MLYRTSPLRVVALSLLTLLPLAPQEVQGQEPTAPFRIADVNLQVGDASLTDLLAAGDLVFFSRIAANDPDREEIWRTNGTADGTFPLTGGCANPPCFRSVVLLAWDAPRARLFFAAGEDPDRTDLWITDGTQAGMHRLSDGGLLGEARFVPWETFLSHDGRFFFPVPGPQPGGDQGLGVSDGTPGGTGPLLDAPGFRLEALGADVQGRVLFTADDGSGTTLWRTDGTAQGTEPVPPGVSAASQVPLTDLGERAVFVVRKPVEMWELWGTDGTTAGTHRLVSLDPSTPGSPFAVAPLADGSAYVFVVLSGGRSLWRTDGTPAGTRRVIDLPPGTEPERLWTVGTTALFATSDPDTGQELWISDGTEQGTRNLDLCPGPCGSFPDAARNLAPGLVYFTAKTEATGWELWASDGTEGGTRRLTDLCPGPCSSLATAELVWNGQILLTANDGLHGTELWSLDASGQGSPIRLTDFRTPDPFRGRSFTAVSSDGPAVFLAVDVDAGSAFWTTDGTREGTGPFVSLGPLQGGGSRPTRLTRFGGELVFFANEHSGLALWRTDGTSEGSRRIRFFEPIRRTRIASLPPEAKAVSTVGNRFFFLIGLGSPHELWTSDGTPRGTRLAVADVDGLPPAVSERAGREGPKLPHLGNVLFLTREGRLHGSDGTPEGTVPLGDVAVESRGAVAEGRLIFAGRAREDEPVELWTSDGTSAGTLRLEVPGQDGPFEPKELTASGDRVFFVAADGQHTEHPWVSDGTPEGTFPLHPPGARDATRFPRALVAASSRLFFWTLPNLEQRVLWVTDGTLEGTRELAVLSPPFGVEERLQETLEDRLFFVLRNEDEDRLEIWTSDGTPEGTGPVPLLPDPTSRPFKLNTVAGRLVIEVFEPANDASAVPFGLWLSDGTPQGTRRLGSLGETGELLALGPRVVTRGLGDATGTELWAFDLDGATPPAPGPCVGDELSLCLGDGRFRVGTRWHDAASGDRGNGRALPLDFSDDSGAFWFFDPDNVELVAKVLDGRTVNDFFWAFHGALSNVEYWVTVTDTETATNVTYYNPPGDLCGLGDVKAFPRAEPIPPFLRASVDPWSSVETSMARVPTLESGGSQGPCSPTARRLCLNDGRFEVEIQWHDPRSGDTGGGFALPGTDDSGYFWFFDPQNVELVVKVLDGRAVNGKFWVFSGGLSDVEYTLTVIDRIGGVSKTYRKEAGNVCGQADVAAF